MGKVIGDITISIDGFVTGPGAGLEHGLGIGGEPIHDWAINGDPIDRRMLAEATAATGAIVMGRNLFDIIDAPGGWDDDMGYGADEAGQQPIFVVTRNPPEKARLSARTTFVPDGIGSAVTKAAAEAGERDVVVMGGGQTVRGALEAGLLDELKLHISPVIMGSGTPLFDGGPTRQLRQIHVEASGHAIHATYRVD